MVLRLHTITIHHKTGLNKTRHKDFGGKKNGQKNELPEPQVDFLLMGIRELVLIATPRPIYRWKAETLSFLYVFLVFGVIMVSS